MLLYYWTRYIIDGWKFQWAPTLGGECYLAVYAAIDDCIFAFQWAPTLGGECYSGSSKTWCRPQESFNGHPPLGVNATHLEREMHIHRHALVSMGTHPWG